MGHGANEVDVVQRQSGSSGMNWWTGVLTEGERSEEANWLVSCWLCDITWRHCYCCGQTDHPACCKYAVHFWICHMFIVRLCEWANITDVCCLYCVLAFIFTAQCCASAVYAIVMHLSVCLSVTSRCSTEMAKCKIMQTMPRDSPRNSSFLRLKVAAKLKSDHAQQWHQKAQVGYVKIGDFQQITHYNLKTSTITSVVNLVWLHVYHTKHPPLFTAHLL